MRKVLKFLTSKWIIPVLFLPYMALLVLICVLFEEFIVFGLVGFSLYIIGFCLIFLVYTVFLFATKHPYRAVLFISLCILTSFYTIFGYYTITAEIGRSIAISQIEEISPVLLEEFESDTRVKLPEKYSKASEDGYALIYDDCIYYVSDLGNATVSESYYVYLKDPSKHRISVATGEHIHSSNDRPYYITKTVEEWNYD